jgi:hypothetical protein
MKRVDVVAAGERKHRGSGAPLSNIRTAMPPQKAHTTVGVYLTSVHLMDVFLTGVHLVRVSHKRDLMGVHLIYESSLRAGHGWRESLNRHQGCFKASGCGRLGRQAAGHLGARSAW